MATRSTPAWEQMKENALPLERGRNISTLEHPPDRLEKERRIAQYEARLLAAADASHAEGDPLSAWMAYIKFSQNMSLTNQFDLLERCVRHFSNPNNTSNTSSPTTTTTTSTTTANKSNHGYANDARFVRICCMYADKTAEPSTTFAELCRRGVGRTSSTFWNAWAFTAERAQNYRLAEQVFDQGIGLQAQPLDYLLLRQKRFQRRMSRYWLNSVMAAETADGGGDNDEELRTRGVLGSLSSPAVRRNDRSQSTTTTGVVAAAAATAASSSSSLLSTFTERSRRTGSRSAATAAQRGGNKENGSSSSFAVFEDSRSDQRAPHFLDEPIHGHGTVREREREQDRWKENRLAAERWNERGALQSTATGTGSSSATAAAAPKLTAFAIHVDEDCAAASLAQAQELERHASQQRTVRRDERASFRDNKGAAPLVGGSSIGSSSRGIVAAAGRADFMVAPVVVKKPDKSTSKKGGMQSAWQNRHLSHDGIEQSFEEARLRAKYYTLVSATNDVNRFPNDDSNGDDSCMSMSMEELMSVDEVSFGKEQSARKAFRPAAGKPPTPQIESSFARSNLSFDRFTPRNNASNASSTIDEHAAVGGTGANMEPTINTQMAMKELSMMFSSPAATALNDNGLVGGGGSNNNNHYLNRSLGPILNESSETAVDPNSSFAAQEEENEIGSLNPNARASPVDHGALHSLVQETAAEESRVVVGCSSNSNGSQPRRAIGRIGQENPFFPSLREHDVPAGFHVYSDEEEKDSAHAKSAFQIYNEEASKQSTAASRSDLPLPPTTTAVGFTVYSDKAEIKDDGDKALDQKPAFQIHNEGSAGKAEPPSLPDNNGSKFQIYNETEYSVAHTANETDSPQSVGDTARFSAVQDIFRDMNVADADDDTKEGHADNGAQGETDSDTATFSAVQEVFNDLRPPKNPQARRGSSSLSRPPPGRQSCAGEGDTATFSMIDGLLRSPDDTTEAPSAPFQLFSDNVGNDSADTSPRFEEDDNVAGTSTRKAFSGTTDTSLARFRRESNVSDLGSPTMFGDISRIAPLSEDTATMTLCLPKEGAMDYSVVHSNDIKEAIVRLKAAASGSFPNGKSLATALSTRRLNCDLPTYVLPRPLKKGPPLLPGTQLKIGFCIATVKQELGRGVYGVVVSLEEQEGQEKPLALKAQSPIGCLAWEYEILTKVEDRLKRNTESSGPPPFPVVLSFVAFADGAMMTMSAGSASGLNLVDLVNVFRKSGDDLPEILALHYTARMLHHLEILHWHAKILHCDAKPDNWVLTTTSKDDGTGKSSSDLMLVDFGRAVDLKSANAADGATTSLMDTVFKGSATTEAMECVSMRQGLPWSFDVDTFGVCASAHVLLFGAHLEIERNKKSKRWMPKRAFPRHFEKKLWTETFDTLLNLEFGVAIGSRPYNLKRLRTQIESYLLREQSRLDAALNRQATVLPSER